MGWYRRRKARKAKAADDRLHGRTADVERNRRLYSGGGAGRSGSSDGWADAIGDAVGGIVEAIIRSFD